MHIFLFYHNIEKKKCLSENLHNWIESEVRRYSRRSMEHNNALRAQNNILNTSYTPIKTTNITWE